MFETESSLASRATEVHVQLFDSAGAGVLTNRILDRSAAVVDAVQKPMREEKRQRAKHGGFVHRAQFVLQVGHRQCAPGLHHRPKNQQPQSRGTDVSYFQFLY